ncbi:MAG: AMP-binding protein [Promethearchaeota archaeon]
MKIASGKITTKKSGNGGYKSAWIYIPSKLYKDNLFPFEENENVLIKIEDNSLLISKNDERSKILKNIGTENETLPKLLEMKAKTNKDFPFLHFKERTFTFQDINRQVNRITHGIINLTNELELKKPKIALLMDNCPEFIFSWFGIIKAGCVFVPISTIRDGEILTHILKDCDCEILFLDFQYLKNFQKISSKVPKIKRVFILNAPKDFNFNNKYRNYRSLITQNPKNPIINIFNQDPVEIAYTDGCTGKPKSLVYRNVVTAGVNIGFDLKDIGLKQGSTIFCSMPLSKGSTRFYVMLPALFYNFSVIISEMFNPITFWDEIKNCEPKPSCFFYFGGHLTELLFQKPKSIDRNHSIKFAYGFGAKVNTWSAFEKRFGIYLYDFWSQMEGAGITMNKVGSKGGKLGSIGKPLDIIELKIVDDKGNELPHGPENIGEIAVRRKTQHLIEYYKPPENIDVIIGKKGWIFTGDFGYMDHDGYIFLKGKKGEQISSITGEQVFAKDIEHIANTHPYIVETAVIPVENGSFPDKELKITAVKVKHKKITHDELSGFLYHNLAFSHVPRYIEFKEELPKAASTEILKSVLRKGWNKNPRNKIWDTNIKDFLK